MEGIRKRRKERGKKEGRAGGGEARKKRRKGERKMGKRETYRQATLHFYKVCLINIYKEKLFENISYLQQDSIYHPYV